MHFRFFLKIILFYGIYINIVCVVDARDKQIVFLIFITCVLFLGKKKRVFFA